ncbi:cytidine deaminase [Tenacibaculum sp. SZ-18]|uniref:cytidine deaminase n=1 Tax=Tenacibaculum sp. SZ-18 TaxID=754423 RepID=UPI000C2D639E|nr:cytidine deaminase [Tenacibaculum sp. SZ-18]AUC14183.1 cytidine deaminase [Tenacibaculum sp. SZ-18]
MEKVNISIDAIVYENLSELTKEDKMLFDKAIEAREKAYAPYSKFKVGAALLLETGIVVTGNNQENAAYPSGMCAERIAIWKAASDYPGVSVKKLVLTAASKETQVKTPVPPCGACRQVLYEYEFNQKEPIQIYFMGETGKIIKVESLNSLLPFSFDSTFL